jgi:hypothetical protein
MSLSGDFNPESAALVAAAVVGFVTYVSAARSTLASRLATSYSHVLQLSVEKPKFFDPDQTCNYADNWKGEDLLDPEDDEEQTRRVYAAFPKVFDWFVIADVT